MKIEMDFGNPDAMKQQFHDLSAKLAAQIAKAAPARRAFDDKSKELEALRDKELMPLRSAMLKAEEGLHEMQQAVAVLARALKGQTATPEHQAEAVQLAAKRVAGDKAK